jgi:hypothetical protein
VEIKKPGSEFRKPSTSPEKNDRAAETDASQKSDRIEPYAKNKKASDGFSNYTSQREEEEREVMNLPNTPAKAVGKKSQPSSI